MKTKRNLGLISPIILTSIFITACEVSEDVDLNPDDSLDTMSSVLYDLTQSEYGKVDAKKLIIDDGNVNNETIYRATGSGNVSPTLLTSNTGYVIGNKLFAENSSTYQNSDFKSVVFATNKIIETLKDKQSGNIVKLSTNLNTLDLSGYQPNQSNNNNDSATIFSDWQGKTANDTTPDWVANIAFPDGSKCYQKTKVTTNRDSFIINSENDKTVAKNLTELKLLIANMDAQNQQLEVSGNFTDVLVGSNNQLPATFSPSKRTYLKNGKANTINFNGGGVVIANVAYQAILYKADQSLNTKNYAACDFYNETAANYIIAQFKKYAN